MMLETLRTVQLAPNAVAWGLAATPLSERISNIHPELGWWQLAQATLPVSPNLPSAVGLAGMGLPLRSTPLSVPTSRGPAIPFSKKSRWPNLAALGSSPKALVVSGGGVSGKGESVRIM